MSEAHIHSDDFHALPTDKRKPSESLPLTGAASFVETFLNSFFQEKNIKWLLIVGAAIVFGSSLMLVMKQWPSWPVALKFLTILGYTAVIFSAAELSRVRLGLQSTYKVLHALTLLLLPVCFLALRWLTSGSATQTWDAVECLGLMLPATAFLWFASRRILDHLLRGRQNTFLISFCLLSIAGVLPVATTATGAFVMMFLCWTVMTVGVIKVNRHTFWLAEENRLPRIFGFLPIAMLSLQFSILMSTKVISAIRVQWLGFSLIMVAATILMTARTVAAVYRQRTGDLVRPLPWSIVVPLFSGLVMMALGLGLSFNGFSYVSTTTYAVIPASIIAAALMFVAAKDTRYGGFVWGGLICTAIGYQCCPVLFADIVHALKESTATAIHRERVPISLYGVTYLPLLTILAGISHWFLRRGDVDMSRPIRHFVTLVASLLFCLALTDVVSAVFVSIANVGLFLLFAVAFRDRRYVLPAVIAVVVAATFFVPAMNDMGHQIPTEWTPTLLASLTVLMTATRLPDRILNTIPLPDDFVLRHVDRTTNRLTRSSLLFQTALGKCRNIVQFIGCVLAVVTSAHWLASSLLDFPRTLSNASLIQFSLLMTALAVYTLRNPHYASGFAFWSLLSYAGVYSLVAIDTWHEVDVLNVISYAAITVCSLSYLSLRFCVDANRDQSLRSWRRQLHQTPVDGNDSLTNRGRTLLAFLVPLCDVSLLITSFVIAPIHLILLLAMHFIMLTNPQMAFSGLLVSTVITVGWLILATRLFRHRLPAVAATIAVPMTATAALASYGSAVTWTWCCVIWAVAEAVAYVVSSFRWSSPSGSIVSSAVNRISGAWLQGLLLLSSLTFDLPWRLVAMICLTGFLMRDRRELSSSRRTYFAIMVSVQLILLAAGMGGCSGFVLRLIGGDIPPEALPLIFLTSAASLLIFDSFNGRLNDKFPRNDEHRTTSFSLSRLVTNNFEGSACMGWSAILRTALAMLSGLSLTLPQVHGSMMAVMIGGWAVFAIVELRRAVRDQLEGHVWSACVIAAVATCFLFAQDLIRLGGGISQLVLLSVSGICLMVAHASRDRVQLTVLRRPLLSVGQLLPMIVAGMAVLRETIGFLPSNSSLNTMALMIAASIYFQQAMTTRRRRFAIAAAVVMNAGLMLLWHSLHFNALEFYLVPVGLSVLGFVELLKPELPRKSHDPLRYMGALTILVSPMFEVLDGNWTHMLTLLVLSVVVILAAIGLRIRVLVYAGSAFLFADLIAMVVKSTAHQPTLLWVYGLAVGISVIALAAFCENHREKLLSRVRLISAELATWN